MTTVSYKLLPVFWYHRADCISLSSQPYYCNDRYLRRQNRSKIITWQNAVVDWHIQTDESNIQQFGKPGDRSKPEFSRISSWFQFDLKSSNHGMLYISILSMLYLDINGQK